MNELDQIMRQREDLKFNELLTKALCTDEDLDTLRATIIQNTLCSSK